MAMSSEGQLVRRLPTFHLGRIVATPGAIVALEFAGADALELLRRHANGDWGDLGVEDKRLNDEAILNGSRILSAYNLAGGERLWVLTEGDRSATTLLLPEEY
jgi:hypothetical protein